MFLAVLSVSALIWLALGRRESAVVLTAIPVTLALTLFVFYLYGYTLNRITLFALIFSIGILVDDAIVVVENIVRHARWRATGRGLEAIAVRAVDEVGNPTILATLTVVAAILPMAFVGGLMGPYMRPIPGRRVGGDGVLAGRRLRRHAVGRRAPAAARARPSRRARGSADRALPPRHGTAHRPPISSSRVSRTGRGAAARRGGARAARPRDGQDAAVRQQERAAGDRPHAGGHAARADGRRRIRARRRRAARRRGDERPELHRHVVAVHVQRPRAALLPAAAAEPGRSAGDARGQRRATASRATRSRSASATRLDPVAARPRRAHSGRGSAAGPAGAADARRRGLRPGPASAGSSWRGRVRSTFEQTPGVVDVDWYVESPQPKWRLDVDDEKAAAAGLSSG